MPQTKAEYEDDVAYDESLDERPTDQELETAVSNLEERGFDVVVVDDADAALDEVLSRIPAGASVMNGHSTTLEEIGFVDHLASGDHDWAALHEHVGDADDDAERARRRREAQAAVLPRRRQRHRADLEAARDLVYPLEDARAQDAYGVGSVVGKEFIYHHENTEGHTTLVLVRDRLGY